MGNIARLINKFFICLKFEQHVFRKYLLLNKLNFFVNNINSVCT